VSPDQVAEKVRARFPDLIIARGEISVLVAREDLLDALTFLRDEPDLNAELRRNFLRAALEQVGRGCGESFRNRE
jgi:hypothetical protein